MSVIRGEHHLISDLIEDRLLYSIPMLLLLVINTVQSTGKGKSNPEKEGDYAVTAFPRAARKSNSFALLVQVIHMASPF